MSNTSITTHLDDLMTKIDRLVDQRHIHATAAKELRQAVLEIRLDQMINGLIATKEREIAEAQAKHFQGLWEKKRAKVRQGEGRVDQDSDSAEAPQLLGETRLVKGFAFDPASGSFTQ